MIHYFECLLNAFRPAFSRQIAFGWFVIALIGFILRTDHFGVTSIIRALQLSPSCYPCLLHFFHSSAWDVQTFLMHWWKFLFSQHIEFTINDRVVFIGDHTKNVKDGRKIPEVETLHQDSETGSKPSYFRGHHWGFIGLLTYVHTKFWSTPLWAEIHRDDLKEKRSTRIVSMTLTIAQSMGVKGYLLLDAFFAVGPVFLTALNYSEGKILHILTRAKKNVTAYLPAPKKKKGKRGKQATYGKKLKLMKLFDSKRSTFTTVNAEIYGTMENVRCLVLDLLWKPIKQNMRFILVESSHGRIILMTMDFSLTPEAAIMLYCKRASIESLFNSFKNLLGGLCYHFWSKYLPSSSRRPVKKNKKKQISVNPNATRLTLQAIEKFVAIQMIVLGALQLFAFKFPKEIIQEAACWMRTPPGNIPSEFITKCALQNLIRANWITIAKNTITALIQTHPAITRESGQLRKFA